MKIKNSLSTFLEQAMVLNNNSLETMDKISSLVSSTDDTVKLTLTDPNDATSTVEYSIPSIGYLKSEIDRLSSSLNTMTNVTNGAGSKIRLSDGSYRKIIASKLPSEAPTITSVGNITNFNFKANWFFEDMLNPALYITWDMSNQISEDTERVMIQRYILKCNTQKKIDIFDNNFKGRNDIDYKTFLTSLINNKIQYTLDDEVKDLPPRSKRYYGTFSVIRITTENDLNNNTVKRYILDSLEFTDSRSGFENTRLLTVGDYVEVNSNPTSTRYKVIYVDTSSKKIGLKCVEGSEAVTIGADTLKISCDQDTDVSAEITIGFNEREVIFVKAIDPDSNIPANKWSPGVGFYSNELTYTDEDGTVQTLQKFYQKSVVDFGQVLLSYAADYYPSIREGINPDPPVLNYANGTGDFKIVQINGQLTESTDEETFRSLVSDKAKVQSELDNIATEISKQKELIQTTQYTSTNEKLKAQNTLDTLISQQETLTSNYNSIVNNIKSKYESGTSAEPKYRVRGFWDMPDSKISSSSGEQKIIKFKIRYRYLSESGNANAEEEYTYTSGNTTITGRFSNWNEIESKLRPRIKTSTGWEWEDIDTADPDAVNINQLDIPINQGEQVEIQVKSVSEAGWPSNPLESVWSDSIIVAFSDFAELAADNVSGLVEQNQVDAAVANITQLYQGTAAHMSSSFYTNDKYFAHTAETITSGFLSAEQTPITLYDKLQDLQNQLTALVETINGTVGDINVVLTDNSDEQQIYALNEGGTTYINAGNYKDAVSSLDSDNQKGAIITKTYYLDITTDAQAGLFLLSKLSGDRLSMCPSTIRDSDGNRVTSAPTVDDDSLIGNSYANYDNVITPSTSSSTYYMEMGRYDLVPINLTNPEIIDFHIGSPSMYQSAQCRGQFVYSRFRNIGDTFDMYANTTDSSGNATFDYSAPFLDSEVYWGDLDGDLESYYGVKDITDNVTSVYTSLTSNSIPSGTDIDSVMPVIYRVPKTWSKTDSSTVRLFNNNKILLRAEELSKLSGISISNSSSDDSTTSTTPTTDTTDTDTDEDTGTEVTETIGRTSIMYQYNMEFGSDDYSTVKFTGTQISGEIPSNASNILYTVNGNGSYLTIQNFISKNESPSTLFTMEETNSDETYTVTYNNAGVTINFQNSQYTHTYTGLGATYSFNSSTVPTNKTTGYYSDNKKPSFKISTNDAIINMKGKMYIEFIVTYTTSTTTTTTKAKAKSVSSTISTQSTTSEALSSLGKISERFLNLSTLSTYNTSAYTIIPKIQAVYGFGDMGSAVITDIDDNEYLTTHKIGYEDKDRYYIGQKSCNSYLFLSPVNHSDIQVDGDTLNSHKEIKNGDTLRVPIIYQYRMTDYAGSIFGDSSYKETDLLVKNAKFANIIGIDIWTDRNAMTPKQYDIVVYSTYGSTVDTNTGKVKTSTQTLSNVGTAITNKLNQLIKDNSSLTSSTDTSTT